MKGQLSITSNSLKALRQEWELKSNQIKHEYKRKQEEVQKQLQKLQSEMIETESMLARWKGSFYEWLTQNKPGWEDTIGRIVDEQQVLYAQGLSPQLTDGSSLFGVSLNVEAIPVHHRTPDDYRDLQKKLQENVGTKKKELADLQTQCENEQENLRKNYRSRISDLSEKETIQRVQLEQIPTQIKDAETRLRQAEQKEQEMVTAEREEQRFIMRLCWPWRMR